MALVECVPNFSEGRRPEVIGAILKAIRSASAARVVDSRSDPDHNRTVVTFIGEPADVLESAYAGAAKAAELIDMDQHHGEHPRIGATDVVPFVPVSGITLEECAHLAKRLAERISKELGIPTYLYEAAATRPDRVDLANIRKGQYEGLKEAIRTDPARKPDFGPSELPKAGATVVGARTFLIAYNVYLNTSDVEPAKEIARSIRHKDGGFPAVKAMGFETKPDVQVSINLNDFRQTPMSVVFDAVRDKASERGLKVVGSEIYGMVPADALYDVAEHHLKISHGWDRQQIIEVKLDALRSEGELLRSMRLERFLGELGSSSPAPGGGSASCLAGAVGAALGAMASRLTVGKKGYEEVQPLMTEKIPVFDELASKLSGLIDQDAEAYRTVMAAYRLPKETEEQKAARSQAIQSALESAADVPLRTASLCRQVIDQLLSIEDKCNKNARSDVAVGLLSAQTGLMGAVLNVETNLSAIKSEDFKDVARAKVSDLVAGVDVEVNAAVERIRSAL